MRETRNQLRRPKFGATKAIEHSPRDYTKGKVFQNEEKPSAGSYRLRFTPTSSPVTTGKRKRFRKTTEGVGTSEVDKDTDAGNNSSHIPPVRASLSELVGTSVLELKATCGEKNNPLEIEANKIKKWNNQSGYYIDDAGTTFIVLNPRQLSSSGGQSLNHYCDNMLVLGPSARP